MGFYSNNLVDGNYHDHDYDDTVNHDDDEDDKNDDDNDDVNHDDDDDDQNDYDDDDDDDVQPNHVKANGDTFKGRSGSLTIPFS